MTSTPGGPGLWEQATSSRGGRLAVALAIAFACLLALTAAVALASAARGQLASAASVTTDDTAKTQGKGSPKVEGDNGDTGSSPGSSDGFAEAYAIGSDTQVRGPAKQGGLSTGTRVTVVASKDGKRALLVASKGGSA